MSWFDILKLGGEDFGTPKIDQESHYDERLTDKRLDFFHNLKDVATTRPHFEYSAKKKYSDNIQGNLREIAQALEGKVPSNNVEYMAFSDRTDSNYLVSFRNIGPEDNYTGSVRPSMFKRPTQPTDLGNTKSVILFDSVYSTHDVNRLREVFGSPLDRLIPIWGKKYDENRLREIMREKRQVNLNELSKERSALINEQKNLERKNQNRKMPFEQREKNKARIEEIKDRVKEINRLTQRKGRRGSGSPPNPFGGPR